jgi:DNA-binding LytR/AlgR family response regulator
VASDIVYMESMGNYVYLNLTGGRQIKTQATLTSLVAQLPAGEFIRIHKSYVVARRHILKFSGRQLWVDGVMLPIGRAYSKSLKDLEF